MMKKTLTVLAASFILASTSCFSDFDGSTTGAAGTVWTAGYGQAELIPPDMDTNTYWIAGYAVDKKITGVLDYQMAKALWLDDNSGRGGIVIVAVDCIGLPRFDVEKIRGLLKGFKEETGCRSINIISTHTHAGADTLGLWGPIGISGRSPEFMQAVYDGVVSAVRQAYDSRQDGRLFYGTAASEGIQRDSRPPFVFDQTLHCLRFRPDSGGGGIRIINYAAHPEALGSGNTLISGDFPAYLTSHIKQVSGDDAIYISAAIGGLISTSRQTDGDGELTEPESTVLTGQRLADFALGITNEREITPDIAVYSKEVALPVDNDVYVISTFLGVLKSKTMPRGGRHNLSMVTEVGLLKLGDLRIFLVPGELFPELAYGAGNGINPLTPAVNPATLTDIAGEGFLIFGLCNDEIGYIVPPSDFFLHGSYPYLQRGADETGRSHYEETNSVGPLTAGLIIGALEELIVNINKHLTN